MNNKVNIKRLLPPVDTKIRFACEHCQRETQHTIMTEVVEDTNWSDGQNSVDWNAKFYTVMCLGCEVISFAKKQTCSEEWDHNMDGTPYYPATIYRYPEAAGRVAMKDSHLLPEKLNSMYQETLGAMNGGFQILTAVGVRGVIETVCKDRSATGDNLQKKIEALIPMGLLTSENAKTLQKLRILGNTAAHEVIPPSIRDLGLALDVCEHLLQGVYILPQHTRLAFGDTDSPNTKVDKEATG
ncbi:DUF4145 domain-containing protein [Xanthomonas campestris pv. campestris]|uniref:DUF4145 domain-containing protein n=1 Tax=Xanthomonas campestris TaxID=339 RepID=UPI00259FF2CF|nr:DUF4145 domain-containing protein [Xanthomonas campestris]MDM7702407.1 DUF4145 domain-containing protein [Xanthomonas campestris pv. campestris]MEA0907747.1 DUF4145 domain-containing protein [Xanthomonas campestris pv. campestris]MEB1944837.1 DUF4145 domain-containing protein [Xanthomonas campestris pv. campestris]